MRKKEDYLFRDDGIHCRSHYDEKRPLLQAPCEVEMVDGFEVAQHMLTRVKKANMKLCHDPGISKAVKENFGNYSEKLYEIVDEVTGYPVALVRESANCCERNFIGPSCRPYNFSIYIRAGPERLLPLAKISKGWSLSFVNQIMEVRSPLTSKIFGYIKPKMTPFRTHFNIYDEHMNLLYTIDGKKCQWGLICGRLPFGPCKRVTFHAQDIRGRSVGRVTSTWGGCCREFCEGANDFEFDFKNALGSLEPRVLLIATGIYLDMRLYSSRCCSCNIRDFLVAKHTPKILKPMIPQKVFKLEA